MPEAVESDSAVYEVSRDLLHELRDARRTPARLLGVGLTGLVDADAASQLGLFPDADDGPEKARDRRVSRAVDHLRDRFGDGAVLPGRILDGRAPGRSPPEDKKP